MYYRKYNLCSHSVQILLNDRIFVAVLKVLWEKYLFQRTTSCYQVFFVLLHRKNVIQKRQKKQEKMKKRKQENAKNVKKIFLLSYTLHM